MAKKSALGNNYNDLFEGGMDLLGDDDLISTLKLNDIEPNRNQPRKDFDGEKLNDLAESISIHGIIQPLTVRPYGETYQIVAGERRWRAARMAGLSEVPVRIMELSDSETMQIALIENLQREDLNPIEEAIGFKELIEKFGMKQEEVAKKVGKARSSITNALRLLTLPSEISELVKSGDISKGHCKALMSAKSESEMIDLANKTVDAGLSVHALEKIVKFSNQEKEKKQKIFKKEVFLTEVELSLTEVLGKPVRISAGKNKITLEIDLSNNEELTEIVNKLGELKNA